MKKILFISLILFGCKKDDPDAVVTPECTEKTAEQYISSYQGQKITVEYNVKTHATSYTATYTKFGGSDKQGKLIWLSVTDTINGGDTAISFQSIKSSGKYHYQIFTLAQTADTNICKISIDGVQKSYRPNYGCVYNFIQYDY